MRKINLKFLRITSVINASLIFLLGFAVSCDKDDEDDGTAEYGCPCAQFKVNSSIESVLEAEDTSSSMVENIDDCEEEFQIVR